MHESSKQVKQVLVDLYTTVDSLYEKINSLEHENKFLKARFHKAIEAKEDQKQEPVEEREE